MLTKFGKDRWAFIHFFFLLLLLLLAVFYSTSEHHFRVRLQNDVFDFFNKLHPRTASDDVIIVDIDEKSLDIYGQWPWPRDIMAAMVDNLSSLGAKVIAFDGVFAEPDRTSVKNLLDNGAVYSKILEKYKSRADFDHDAMLARSIKKSGIFVTSFTYGRKDRAGNIPLNKNRIQFSSDNVKKDFIKHAKHFSAAAVNLPEFSKNAAGNGSFMANPDSDGILRRAAMVFSDGKSLYPSLSLSALRIAILGHKGIVRIVKVPQSKRSDIDTAYRITVGNHAIPVENDGLLYIYFRRFCNEQEFISGSFISGSSLLRSSLYCQRQDYLSAYKVLDQAYKDKIRPMVEGKIVLIGTSAEGLKDLRSTALQSYRPGVEIHANVIEQVMQGRYLLRPDIIKGAEVAFILITGLFFIVLAPFIGVLVSLALCIAIIGFAFFYAYSLYVDYGILIDPVYPSLSVFLIFITSTILSYARAESMRKQIRQAFGMYVAPDVMRELEDNPEKLKLGGETRNLSVMFSDIRGFTKISEELSPQEIISLMNEFLTLMSDIVLEHRGTVDKYIGDAMMAFWNAPKDVEDHQYLSCRAALLMQDALAGLNEKINSKSQYNSKAKRGDAGSKRDSEGKSEGAREKAGAGNICLRVGIGIATGLCAVGNMGSSQRFAYSALGDSVNLASRLESLTKFYGVSILISGATFSQIKDRGMAVLELDIIRVFGKSKSEHVYALLGDEEYAAHGDFGKWSIEHEIMLAKYRSCDFTQALQAIEVCMNLSGGLLDKYYSIYKERIKALQDRELPADWDAVYDAKSK